MNGPKEASTRRQLETIRKALRALKLGFEEAWDATTQVSFFTIDTGVSELETLCLQHEPGVLVALAEFGVHPAEARRREVERLAARLNASWYHGCALVLRGRPVRIVYRASVDYSRVKNLEAGYVAGLVANVIDAIPVVDLPLILVAKGKSADEAIAEVLELEELKVGPKAPVKRVRKGRRSS